MDATQRVLGLAVYLEKCRAGVTLEEIATDVPGYEAGDLVAGSKEWETTRKRLQRDLNDLDRSFDVLVDYDEADHVYRLRSAFFTTDERLALIAAAAAVDVEGIDDEPVLGELGAAVGEQGRRIVLSVPALVRRLSDSIRERRPARFAYHGSERTLRAYAVGRWRTHWYVVGQEDGSDDRRRYRLDRIESLEGSDALALGDANSYEIPIGFDSVDAMRLDPNDWGTDPLAVALVRVDADHVHTFQRELGGRVVERSGDSQTFEIEVRHYESFRDRILGFGTWAVVIAPDDLVALVRDHLAAVAGGPS